MAGESLILFGYFAILAYGLLVLGVLVPRDYGRRAKLSPLVAILQALLFFAYGGFPALYLPGTWPAVDVSPFFHALGLTLLVGGLATLLYAMIRLGILRSTGYGDQRLQRSGIYRLTRNPQAISCGLYVLGFLVLWPSWHAFAWTLLYPVLIHAMVLAEEEHLSRVHGQAYRDYCAQAPRYFRLPTALRRRPVFAALLSFLVPGLGQIWIGAAERGASLMFASIVIGSLHIIWLSLHAGIGSEVSAFWATDLPRYLHDLLALWSVVFWGWIVIDAFGLASEIRHPDR